MLNFILRRLGTMLLTMLCLTMVVFYMVNLEPNLRKLSISQLDMRSSDEHIEQWLVKNGFRENFFVRYGQWIGVIKRTPDINPATGESLPRQGLRTARRALLRRHPAGQFRLLDQVQDDGLRQAVAGAGRHRNLDVLGHGGHGADLASDRYPRGHA